MLHSQHTSLVDRAVNSQQEHAKTNKALALMEEGRLAAVEVLGLTAEDLEPLKVTVKKVYR